MSAVMSTVVAFPTDAEKPQPSLQNKRRSAIIVTDEDRDETVIRFMLDDTGQPRTAVRATTLNTLREAFEEARGDIVVVRDTVLRRDPRRLSGVLKQLPQRVPVLILCDEVEEESIGRYLAAGARDVVSLDHPNRLQAVVTREFDVVLLRRAFKRTEALSSHYKNQVKLLTESSTQGIVDVVDGSIVAANSAWTKLFHYKDSSELQNTPVLDLIENSQRSRLKQLMVERQDGKRHGPAIKVIGEGADGANIPLNMHLERIRVGRQTTIRFTAWPDSAPSSQATAGLDSSTQLFNRAYFVQQLEKQLCLPLTRGVRALVYIRLDQFSKITNQVGILKSEQVVTHFAKVLRELAHPSDLCGRFGGTVFTVLINRGSMREVAAWVEYLNKMVAERPFAYAGKSVKLSCTAGICEVTDSGMTTENILREAHDACHRGRLMGGGKVHLSVSSQAAHNKSRKVAKQVSRIQQAVRNNRLRLIRQPVIKLDDSYCKIRDAWVRIIDEDGKDILPREFMPIAEKHNLMTMIDRWVIGAAITYCAKRQPDLIFIRLSRDSVLDESLTDWVLSIINASSARPAQICFQTTEKIATQFLKQTILQARRLTEAGFKFAIDQLGTSPETMNILRYVPLQYARIDAALMQSLAGDKKVQAQVRHYVSAAKDLGIHTVGERIEDAVTMAAACKIGIEYAQGDYVWQEDIVLEDTHTLCTPILPMAPINISKYAPASSGKLR